MSNMGRCGQHGCAFSVRLVNGQRDEYCPECEIDRLRAALATAQAERDRAHQSALDWKATWEQTQDALTEARSALQWPDGAWSVGSGTEPPTQEETRLCIDAWRVALKAALAERAQLQQKLHEAEERAIGDDATFKRLISERTVADQQRDAALSERWKLNAEVAQARADREHEAHARLRGQAHPTPAQERRINETPL